MTDLPAAIRALPPTPPPSLALVGETPLYLAGYRDGHRAARHSAAELAERYAGATFTVDTYTVEVRDPGGPWRSLYAAGVDGATAKAWADDLRAYRGSDNVRVVRDVTRHAACSAEVSREVIS